MSRLITASLLIAGIVALVGCTKVEVAPASPTPTALQRFDAAVRDAEMCQGPIPGCLTILHNAIVSVSVPPVAVAQRDALEAAITRALADCEALRQAQPGSSCSSNEGGLAGDGIAINAAIGQLRSTLAAP